MAVHNCVGALLVRAGDEPRLLLGLRSPTRAFVPNVWDVPGGHCEPGETPDATLVRELREEIGVTPTAWRHVGVLRAPIPDSDDSLVLHMYTVTGWEGTPHNRLPEEHAEIAWFTLDAACGLRLADAAYPAWFRRMVATA